MSGTLSKAGGNDAGEASQPGSTRYLDCLWNPSTILDYSGRVDGNRDFPDKRYCPQAGVPDAEEVLHSDGSGNRDRP